MTFGLLKISVGDCWLGWGGEVIMIKKENKSGNFKVMIISIKVIMLIKCSSGPVRLPSLLYGDYYCL